jgi:ABC-type transport system involved in multi-copper enzyme maturation permease subunit
MSTRETTLPTPQQAQPARRRGVGSRASWLTIAAQMMSADFLKLRKKRGTVIWALLLAIAPLVIYFIVRGVQHSSNPAQNPPAGGVHAYTDALRLVGAIFGPLAAILIGAEAGAGDVAVGVFRDLVATGRSRLALFATRVPAAIALSWIVTGAAYAVLVIGIYALAAGSPTPSATEMLDGFGFSLLSTGVICAIAVGLGAMTASRPATLTALIGWQLIASPILANISSLGNSRKLILSQATFQFSPIKLTGGHGAQVVTMATGTALAVLAVWLVVFLALGAWRTRTMDA